MIDVCPQKNRPIRTAKIKSRKLSRSESHGVFGYTDPKIFQAHGDRLALGGSIFLVTENEIGLTHPFPNWISRAIENSPISFRIHWLSPPQTH
jgi:hypothetical protein